MSKEGKIAQRNRSAEALVDGVDPFNSNLDRRILFEMTKRRTFIGDYESDTSADEDMISESGDDERGTDNNQIDDTEARNPPIRNEADFGKSRDWKQI